MTEHTLLIDAHVHIYPSFELSTALQAGTRNLLKHANGPRVRPVWLLTEREDCHFFDDLSSRIEPIPAGWNLEQPEETVLRLRSSTVQLLVAQGRQLVSCEGLEISALLTSLHIADRSESAQSLIEQILDTGGIPVLNWAPGKWFFKRGHIVTDCLQRFSPQELAIGDTSMRPIVWPLPGQMKTGRKRGFSVVAGSDPLPFPSEVHQIGSYGIRCEACFDDTKPATALRYLFRTTPSSCQIIGRRSGPLTFLSRQTRIMREKKTRSLNTSQSNKPQV